MADVVTDWREQYAYTLGLQAYIYGFPWVFLPQLRWQWITQPVSPDQTPYVGTFNHFWHAKGLTDATYRDGGAPNNDTMYSVAWVDVRKEPVILSHPDMGERYFTFELASLDSDNFDYVGKRATGSHAGHYALVGPGWKGSLPPGVKALAPSRTPTVLVLGRTLVESPEDVANVRALQAHYQLTPLSLWGQPGAQVPEDRSVWQPVDPKTDPLAVWKTMNRAMTEEPPEARHAALLKLFSTIGVGPNQQVERLDQASQRGLARVAEEGQKFLVEVLVQGGSSKRINGWLYPPPTLGRAGLHDDFLTRGAIQCAAGLIAHDPEEAVYLNVQTDGQGQVLTGDKRYRLHFAPDGLPKVNAFWSLTMYGKDNNLVANPLNRYSIGDRTPGVRRDPDGGLTLYVQSDPPAAEQTSNWLPAPKAPFYLILRTYLPAREIVEQTWQPPALHDAPATRRSAQPEGALHRDRLRTARR